MIDHTNPPQLVKTDKGYFTYRPQPSESDLAEYYREKYYQEGKGSYAVSYTDDELTYLRLKARMIYRKCSELLDHSSTVHIIDVGCGEGWVIQEYIEHGHDAVGIDYSRFGIEKFHPHLLNNFMQGDINKILVEKIELGEKYDLAILANVIEHVPDPEALLRNICKLLIRNGLLVIVAPNDFSALHNHLLQRQLIHKKFWLAFPDHLSYFNKESMERVMHAAGYNVLSVVADNPIDINLLNDNSNYIECPEKGKNTHHYRVRHDTFLAGIDEAKLLHIYETLGSMGVGRDLTYYCRWNGE